MVPEIVRLERAGVCGCGELVAAGEQAGYAAPYERVVCLGCVAAESAEAAPADGARNGHAVVPAIWTTDEMVIAATLKALRAGSAPTRRTSAPDVLHVPTEWSTLSPATGPGAGGPGADGPEAAPPEQLITLPRRKPRTEPSLEAYLAGPTADEAVAQGLDEVVAPTPADVVAPVATEPLAPVPELSAVAETAAEVAAPTDIEVAAPTDIEVVAPASGLSTVAPTSPETETRRSRHEAAAVEDLGMPAAAPRRRAGLFSRLLTVRAFRTQQAQPRVSKAHVAVRTLLGAATAKGVLSLHNRRVPGRRGPIEHIAIGASGVYVIDALHFKNASIEVRPSDEADASGDDLLVGGRVMTGAVRAVAQRVEVLRLILVSAGLDNVPVTGALCFVDGLLPLGVADLEVGGMHVLRPSGLTALVAGAGAAGAGVFGPADRQTLQDFLAERLPAVA